MSFINILSYVMRRSFFVVLHANAEISCLWYLTTASLVAIVFLKQMSLWVFSVLSIVLCVRQQ